MSDSSIDTEDRLDAVIIGAGFAGLYMVHNRTLAP